MAYNPPYIQYDNSAIQQYLRRGNVNHKSLENKKIHIQQKMNAHRNVKTRIQENFQKNLDKKKLIAQSIVEKSRKAGSVANRSIVLPKS